MYRTTADYILLLKNKLGFKSWYQLAVHLEKSDSQIAAWRKGRRTFDDHSALIIAEQLKIDPLEIVTNCHIERAEKAGDFAVAGLYRKMLHKLAGPVAAGFAAFMVGLFWSELSAPLLGPLAGV